MSYLRGFLSIFFKTAVIGVISAGNGRILAGFNFCPFAGLSIE